MCLHVMKCRWEWTLAQTVFHGLHLPMVTNYCIQTLGTRVAVLKGRKHWLFLTVTAPGQKILIILCLRTAHLFVHLLPVTVVLLLRSGLNFLLQKDSKVFWVAHFPECIELEYTSFTIISSEQSFAFSVAMLCFYQTVPKINCKHQNHKHLYCASCYTTHIQITRI